MFELPIEIVGLITIAIAFLVAQGVKGVASLFGWDIGGYAAAFTALVVGLLVLFIEGFVGMFPADVQEIVVLILQAFGMIFGMFGAHKTYKGLGNGA